MAETRRTSERRKASVSTGASAGKDWDVSCMVGGCSEYVIYTSQGTINDLSTMKFNDEELVRANCVGSMKFNNLVATES